MRIWLNKYFGFSKGEFNGLMVLIVIIILLKSSSFLIDFYTPLKVDDYKVLAGIQKIEVIDQKRFQYIKDYAESPKVKSIPAPFKFDPNTIDAKGWQALGLSLKQAQSIVNYRNKGGKFYKAEDLQKMYTISPEVYKRIFPYVEIQSLGGFKKDTQYEKKEYVKKAISVVDINQADSAMLDELKGIGPAFAQRIIKYRTRLGGFYKKEQLMEVYGLDSVKYAEIKEQLVISPSTIKTININTADFSALKSSPYLSYKQINAIIQYRKQHGNYSNINDLKKVLILNPAVIDKIAPYLTF